jgi:thiamine biosynthesis protein ThiI
VNNTITFLIKLGELTLKGENRVGFEHILKRNLKQLLKGTGAYLNTTNGRYFVHAPEGSEERAEAALKRLFGISAWAKTRTCEKTTDDVFKACIEEARTLVENGVKTFKIEARRTDKSFPLDSYALMADAGEAVLNAEPSLKVDVHKPDAVIDVEIREKAYVYSNAKKGLRGLPVGTAGRGLLLLSGGIDSPVAGFLMAGRGMGIDAVYFHAFPYTSEEARQKVIRLAEIVGGYAMGVRLHIVGFTEVQMRIKENAPLAWTTILLRMAMMEAAERIARAYGHRCLISGESLSQVASQTAENIACTQSRVTLPVFRPLIGMDKEDTIRLAEKIGTYSTSILPYEDCCVLFSPDHPVLRGDVAEANALYEGLELGALIADAVKTRSMEQARGGGG